ncbi:MAG: metal-dependent hydrolase [Acidimicrobiales bacterium]|nr:metal-dependent hydrolase [Acidimicrobiales bacterium]
MSSIPVRRVRFRWPDDLQPIWAPRQPELSIAANAVSMLMPHMEPYVVASVRSQVDELRETDPELAEAATAYVAQEAQHHAQHRRFNDIMVRHYPGLVRVERAMAWVFAKLRRRSPRFGLAFAAGFECIAFIAARWVDRRQSLLRDADPTATTLFLWHLAEEVEHKEVAFDVYEASGGGRIRYLWATWVAGVVLATFALACTWVMLWSERRFWRPGAHLKLLVWSVSFIFVALPAMITSALPGHHPRNLANPVGLEHWLDNLDPETSTVPEWALP